MYQLRTPYLSARTQEEFQFKKFITEFNKIPKPAPGSQSDPHAIQRIFYLQKINFILNKLPVSKGLLNWINSPIAQEDSWENALLSYGITPHASFFLKGAQYAKAVAARCADHAIAQEGEDIHILMQERDALLIKESIDPGDQENYINLCCRINHLVQTQKHYKDMIERQQHILKLADIKIRAIQEQTGETSTSYLTKTLSKGNNNNFMFKIKEWDEYFIFRFEDRTDLDLEQYLHGYPVAMKYFAEDFAVFMMQHKDEEDKPPVVRTAALTLFANQGSLLDVAEVLYGKSLEEVLKATTTYFTQLADFCIKLEQAGAIYHPDIKLSNFLVHDEKLLVSDRKAFVYGQKQRADQLRVSEDQAPPEFINCVEVWPELKPIAAETYLEMKQFMAYQLGIVLKEFLARSQTQKLPADFFKPQYDVKKLFAEKSNHQVDNFNLIIHAMTDPKAGERLSIEEFQQLIPFVNEETAIFLKKLEQLIIESEINSFKQILQNKELNGTDLLIKAGKVLDPNRLPLKPEVKPVAEQLAIRCYEEQSKTYWTQHTNALLKAIAARNWEQAPLYRKIAYYLTFGLWDVPQVTQAQDVTINLDITEEAFAWHVSALDFLPKTYETKKLELLKAYIVACYEKLDLNTEEPAAQTESPQEQPAENETALEDTPEIEAETEPDKSHQKSDDSQAKFWDLVLQQKQKAPQKVGPQPISSVARRGDASPRFFGADAAKEPESPTKAKKLSIVKVS